MSYLSIGEQTLARQGRTALDNVLHAKQLLDKRLREIPADVAGSRPALEEYIGKTNYNFLSDGFRPGINAVSHYSRQTLTAQLTTGGTIPVEFTLPNDGHLISDICFEVEFSETTVTGSNTIRYCALPGIRLIDKAELTWGGETIATYTVEDVNMSDKFEVGPGERDAWSETMGQQPIKYATTHNTNGYTSYMAYTDGPQTRKTTHPAWSMFIPAQFSFCKDAGDALIRTDIIGRSQNRILLTLGKLDDLLYEYDVLNELTKLNKDISSMKISITMHTKIYTVDQSIYRALINAQSVNAITTRRSAVVKVDQDSDDVQIPLSVSAASHMFVGVRATANAADPDRWHLFGIAKSRSPILTNQLVVPISTGNSKTPTTTGGDGIEQTGLEPLVAKLGLRTDFEEVFALTGAGFYGTYNCLVNSANTRVYSTKDRQAFMLKFNEQAGARQMANYLGLSSATNPRVTYESDSTNKISSNISELVVSIVGFNFLYTDQKDSLRIVFPGS